MGRSESIGARVEEFARKAKMVLRMATTPSEREFWQFLKVIFLMIVVLGAIGFAIRFMMQSFVGTLGG